MEDCYICKELKENGGFERIGSYTTLAINKDDSGKYRCFAWGEGEASVDCNFCPHCGRQLEETVNDVWSKLRIELEKRKIERKFANDVERFTAYDSILDYMNKLEEGRDEEDEI